MNKKELWTAFALTIGVTLVVASSASHVLDSIIVPAALVVFGFIAFLAIVAIWIYARKYIEDHPYIPYVGQHAKIYCKPCMKRGHMTSRIELRIGNAFEVWTGAGRYARVFKRTYQAHCSNGHSWTFDPILERNVQPVEGRRSRGWKRSDAARAALTRSMRNLFRETYIEPHLHPDIDGGATAPA